MAQLHTACTIALAKVQRRNGVTARDVKCIQMIDDGWFGFVTWSLH